MIREFVKLHNFTIVTFDSDFADIALSKGFLPKIIWLRTGNTTTDNLADLISANRKSIIEFLSSIDEAVLILN